MSTAAAVIGRFAWMLYAGLILAGSGRAAEPAKHALDFTGSKWIWTPPPASVTLESFQGGTAYFRLPVNLPPKQGIRSAEILITADNLFTLYINGKPAAESETWSQPKRIAIGTLLAPGANVVAVKASNTVMGPAGLLVKIAVECADGQRIELASNPGWRCSDSAAEQWQQLAFDDKGWRPAHVLGDVGMPPWGKIAALPEKADSPDAGLASLPKADFQWPAGGLVFVGEDCSLYPGGQAGPGSASLGVTVFTARRSRAYPEHDLPAPVKVGRKLFALQEMRPGAKPVALVDAGKGALGSPSVSYDGKRIYISMALNDEPFFHIYSLAADGRQLQRLTDGPFHDIDPAELPDGRIVFTSTRIGTFEEYHNPPSRALFVMERTGGNIQPLTHTFVFDNEAKVLADGRILFIRSDNFFDRGKVETLLHAMHPDGTHGFTEFGLDLGPGYGGRLRAFYCGSPAPMQDGRVAFVSSGGIVVGRPGSLQRDQRNIGLQAGDVAALPDNRLVCTMGGIERYEKLAILNPDARGLDTAVIYDAQGMALHSPVYLGPRLKPPVLAGMADGRELDNPRATGFLLCQNARFTQNTTAGWKHVRAIRVLGGKGLTTRSSHSYIVHAGNETVELGTFPLAPDGSFFIEVPADMAISLQAVDAEGRSELNEMSWISVKAGEKRSCLGCHQPRQMAPAADSAPLQALQMPPLRLLGQGQPHRFRGNNAAVTGLMELQFDRYREVAGLNRHSGSADPMACRKTDVALLASQLRGRDEDLKVSAAQRLAIFRDPSAAAALCAALKGGGRESRVAAAMALAACGSRDSVPPLLAALDDSDALVAQAASVALENLTGRTGSFDAFVPPAERRRQAAEWCAWHARAGWDTIEQDQVRRLDDKDRDVARRAAVALGHTGGDAARAALRAYVARERDRNPFPAWRKSHSGDGAQFDALSEANPRAIQAAARALGYLQDRDAVPLLVETLNHHSAPATGNLFLAEAAAEALGRIAAPEVEPALVNAFARLGNYIDYTVWYGDHPALMACHASPVHAFILEALDALESRQAESIVPHIIRSVATDPDRALFLWNDDYETLAGRVIRRNDPGGAVMETCLAVLGDQHAAKNADIEQALGAVHAAWGGRPDLGNRAAQILSLTCRDKTYVPRILAALDRYRSMADGDIPRVFSKGIPVVDKLPVKNWVCFFLARALGNLADARSVEPLVVLLEQTPPEAAGGYPDPTGPGVLFLHNGLTPCYRAAAAWALGQAGDKRAVPVLLAVAGDMHNAPDTRHAAASALERIGDPSSFAAIAAMAKEYPEVSTRKALLRAARR